MKIFEYVITDALGIHARPAGALVKEAKKYQSKITMQKGEKEADISRLMALMSLAVKCGDKIIVKVEGADEESAAEQIEAFLKGNL